MITSPDNPQIKRLTRLLRSSRARDGERVFVAEGARMLSEAPADLVEKIYMSETFYRERCRDVPFREIPAEILSDGLYARISDTDTPQGILGVVGRRDYSAGELIKIKDPLFVVLDGLRDPGNLGTVVRSAEGAGADGVFMSGDCVDLYNPKTVRATMGSLYRMPTVRAGNIPELIRDLNCAGVKTYAAVPSGGDCRDYDGEDYGGGCAFLIGNEGSGLSAEICGMAGRRVRIPMRGHVESLNAAVAASVLLFEAERQRRKRAKQDLC